MNLDLYFDKVKLKIDIGIKFMKQKKFDESIQLFQIALTLVKEKYNTLPETITTRFYEVIKIREIKSLISQSEIRKLHILNRL